jgi:hypothetical protein
MKKGVLAASIAIMLLMPFILVGCSSQNPEGEGFAVYLTRDDIPVSQMEALSHVEIADTPVISTNDIITYDWNNHEIELTVDAYERVQALIVPTSGKSFLVCVDKGPIYWGAFWTPISSQSFDGVTITIPLFPPGELSANSIRISLGYPSESFFQGEDTRYNPQIFDSLEEAGKLK